MLFRSIRFIVKDVQKIGGTIFLHKGTLTQKSKDLKVGQRLLQKIDRDFRKKISTNHSATHLLHESLRQILGDHISQKGSLVNDKRLRFDFSHQKPIPNDDILEIEKIANYIVMQNNSVETQIMSTDDAMKTGARALFGEKYGEEVRVLSMGDDDGKYFSTELCGGTHVKNTGDIGQFKITSQSSIAAGIRRIEALRDKQLEDFLKNKEKLLNQSSEKNEELIKDLTKQIIGLGGKPNIDQSDKKLLIKNLTKQLETLSVKVILNDKTKNQIKDEEVKGTKIRFQKVDGLPPKELRKLVDDGKKQLGEGIVVVFANKDEKVGVAVGVTNRLIDKFDAVKFVKLSSEIIGGQGGGGRKDFAQAGGQDPNKINEAFEKIKSLI